jgi:thioredoxin 1
MDDISTYKRRSLEDVLVAGNKRISNAWRGWHGACVKAWGQPIHMNKRKTAVWVGEKGFDARLQTPTRPVLVAFLAPWSRPCKIVDSVIDKVAVACEGKARVIKINADNHPALSLLFDVLTLPTLLYFLNGTVQERMVGTVNARTVLSQLKALGRAATSGRSLFQPQ